MSETLHSCPHCGRENFTARGLAAHRCKTPSAVDLCSLHTNDKQPASVAKLPVVGVTGTWDGARKWRDAAVRMEQGKLFCQVMLGFELLALRKALEVKNGGDRKSEKSESQSGILIWDEVLEKELGLSRTSAYRMIQMAEAAKPRLKKLPGLRDFDPTAQAVQDLPEAQQAALGKAVQKLTDGVSQVEFMRELGLAKLAPGGKGRAKGSGGRPPTPSLSEQAELLKQDALEHLGQVIGALAGLREKFVLLPDEDCRGLENACETHLKAVRQWLAKPPAKRDASEIAALFAE